MNLEKERKVTKRKKERKKGAGRLLSQVMFERTFIVQVEL